jgi:hypothetical protein
MRRLLPALGAVGLIATGVGFAVAPERAAFAYLAAYACVLAVALGALILVMIHHAAGARWFLAVRRVAEAIAAMLVPLALLFVPIALSLRRLYPWTDPTRLEPDAQDKIAAKHAYLQPGFFLGRAVFFLASFVVVALLLGRWSRRQDDDPAPVLVVRQRLLSVVGLPVIALTLTFAAFDWLMSLTPTWYSTIYGIYFWAGGFVAAVALTAIVAHQAGAPEVRPPHFYALGRLMLAFTIFWAYIAYAQGFITWIANKPDEVVWYVPRLRGSWGATSLVLIGLMFATPFALLLSQEWKYRPRAVAAIGVVLLVGHVVDAYWMVLPALEPAGVSLSWIDLAALAGVAGSCAAFARWRLRGAELVPRRDPGLAVGLAYQSPLPATSARYPLRGGR